MSSYNGFRTGSNSYGQFWFGGNSFPGFLYKKNVGVGTRRSTQFTPGGTITCNQPNYLYNKYKPGNGGVGASSISNRRAKNRLATVCVNNNCFPCFSTLGQYSNYTHNPNGFIPCPGTINITNSSSSTPSPSGTYTVRYLGNGSNGGFVPVDGSSPYIPGSTVTVLSNTFTRAGYTFAGWSTNSAGTGSDYNGGDLFIINANTIFYAQWIPIIVGDYTLTYNGNGGTGSEPALTTEYTSGTPVTVLGNSGPLTKPGVAVFAGWNTAADGTGSNYVGGDTFNITQNTTLYAQWIVAGSRIRYFAGAGGSGSAPSSSGTYYTPFSNAVIANNTGSFTNTISPVFAGWNTAANGSGTSYPEGSNITMPASGTVDLYAQWIPAGGPFTLTYAAGTGGTGTPPSSSGNSYSAGSPANIVSNTGSFSNATLPVFNGWNSAADGSGTSYPAGSKITMTSDTTLYAQWGSSPPVTVTYIANGASGTIPFQTYPTGAQATILGQSSLTRPGYSFLGWNSAPDGTGSIYQPTSSVVINSNITIYAQWASGTAIKDCGSFTGSVTIPNIYLSGGRTVFRDTTNNTITIIIPTLYSGVSPGLPYGIGNGPTDTGGPVHIGNLNSSYATATISQIAGVYQLNTTYTTTYTGGTYTQTSTLPLGSTYWPTGETISTVTYYTSNSIAGFIFDPIPSGIAGQPGTNTSVSGCFGGASYSAPVTTLNSIVAFYINFSNGTSTRVALGTQFRWSGITNPYTYVFNYTRGELANGPTPSPITGLFTPTASTGVNTPNV
jgi:uncharacterized repeat protein (TIGR02543 family)